MVREEFIAHAERHMPRIPGVFYLPSSAEPSPPPSPPRASEPRPKPSAERCLVETCAELKSWVLNNLPRMREMGMRINTSVYKQMQRTIEEDRPGRRTTVAIIPTTDDEDDMKRTVDLYIETLEYLGIRFRTLFDCVLVLIGDFDEDR